MAGSTASSDARSAPSERSPPTNTNTHSDGNPRSHPDDQESRIHRAVTPSNPPSPEQSVPPTDPPLPPEAPPLPSEAPPQDTGDDGWEPVWDHGASAYYFYNRHTQRTQWENPRVPEATTATGLTSYQTPSTASLISGAPGLDPIAASVTKDATTNSADRPRYNPAIHGSYDPNADYARADAEEAAERDLEDEVKAAIASGVDPAAAYAATGRFNRFTGKWQKADLNPENFNDENKSYRQQNAFFDVEAAANSHDGKSLKAERAGKKLSKEEVKAFKEKRRAKKEEKRRAWLRD